MKRVANALAWVYFLMMAVAVTYPGVQPFNTIRPFVFGLPFAFAWPVFWVVGAGLVFYFVHRTHRS
ncbi:MAG: hypothetical protein A2W29_03715 [Gemmatimonadetes bacterium RBG_16_66_8]|nr:MAG: hypothetical protein A2W29_03715 [Gemmatimonadetes bacterium RBG_16_66_8]